MKAIFQKELRLYFCNMSGYIFTAFILLFAGIYVMVINLNGKSANFEYVLGNMSFVYLVAVPVLTMRSVAEDRKQKTDRLYYSLPLKLRDVILGKYFAMLTVLAVPTIIMGIYPLFLSIFGKISFSASYGNLLAFFLLGAALIAIGMFISSLTENQAISAVVCLIILLINYYLNVIADIASISSMVSMITIAVIAIIASLIIWYLSKSGILALLFLVTVELIAIGVRIFLPNLMKGLLPAILKEISIFEKFYLFPNGVFDLNAILYFVVISVIFVYFTIQVMEKRRWG